MSNLDSFNYKVTVSTMMQIVAIIKDFLSRENINCFFSRLTNTLVITIAFLSTQPISFPSKLMFTLAYKICI